MPKSTSRAIAVISVSVRVLCLGALFALSSSITALGQSAVRGNTVFSVANPETLDALTVQDLDSGEVREIHRAEAGRIFDFAPAPSAPIIAVTEQVKKYDVESASTSRGGHRRLLSERIVLHLITNAGLTVEAIEQVRTFAWSPDSRELVYVTGVYRGDDTSYSNTVAWIWNAADRSRRKITDQAYDVAWATFDGHIYLWERKNGIAGRVYRYNVLSNSIETTPHKSIYFSPGGTYYYHPGGGIGLPENVYLRSTDASLKQSSRALAQFDGWRPVAWAPDADLLLLEVNRRTTVHQRGWVIFDPAVDTTIDLGEAESVHWGNTSSEIVLKSGGRFVRIKP